MQRYQNSSPRTRLTPQIKVSKPDSQTLVQDLQLKLVNLESKYSHFVEKCSILLQSKETAVDSNDLFSEWGSSLTPSPDIISHSRFSSQENNERLIEILQDIEKGSLLRQLMEKITEVVARSREKVLNTVEGTERIRLAVKEALNLMLGEIWEVMFENESSLQGMIKYCYQRIGADNLNEKTTSEKYKKCLHEKKLLEKKLHHQEQCLKRIQSDHNKLKQSMFVYKKNTNKSTGFQFDKALMCVRSLTASPGPEEKDQISRLKEKNAELKQKMRNLSAKSFLRNPRKSNEKKEEMIDSEKKEIQDQLLCLQNKLIGFEKIAKDLIDNSIRTELNQVGQTNKRTNSSKFMAIDSPELSIMNSHCSLLELDHLQKNFEGLEREKLLLESTLADARKSSDKVSKDLAMQVQRNQELEELVSSLMKEKDSYKKSIGINAENHEKALTEKIKSINSLSVMNKELAEGKKMLSEKISEKDNEIQGLVTEVSSMKIKHSVLAEKAKALKASLKECRDDKAKLIGLSAKHSDSISTLELSVEDFRRKEAKLKEEILRLTEMHRSTKTENQLIENKVNAKNSHEISQMQSLIQSLKLTVEKGEKEEKLISEELAEAKLLLDTERTRQELLIKAKDQEISERVKQFSELIDLKEKTIENLRQIEVVKDQEAAELSEKNKSLVETIKLKDKTIENLTKGIESKNEEIRELEILLGNTKKDAHAMERRLKEIINENEARMKENYLKISYLSELISLKEKAVNDLKNVSESKKQEIKELKCKLDSVLSSIDTKENLISELRNSISFQEKEASHISKDLLNSLNSKKLEIVDLCQQLDMKEQQLTNMKETLCNFTDSTIKKDKRLSEYEEKILFFQSESAKLSETLANCQATISYLESELHKSKTSQISTTNTYELQIQELQAKIKEENLAKMSLESELSQCLQKIEALNIEISQQKQKITSIEKELLRAKATISDYADSVKCFQESLNSMNQTNSKLKKEIEEHKSGLKMRDDVIYEYAHKTSESKEKCSEQALLIESLNRKIDMLESQMIDFNELKNDISNKKSDFLLLDKENQKLVINLQSHEKYIKDLSESVEKLKAENLALKVQCKDLATNSEKLSEINRNQHKSNERLENILIEHELQYKKLEKTLQDKEINEEEYRNIISELQLEVDRLKANSLKPEFLNFEKAIGRKSVEIGDSHVATNKRTNSFSFNEDQLRHNSEPADPSNTAPSKVIKVVSAANKKWFLVQNGDRSLCWKTEISCRLSLPLDESVVEEPLESIKECLGGWYTGSIIEAIEKLKGQAMKDISLSFQEDELKEAKNVNFNSKSFREDVFDGSFNLSRITPVQSDYEIIEQLKKEEAKKDEEVKRKKKKIILHKEQINLLKEQMRKMEEEIRELRVKLETAKAIEVSYLKQVFSSLIAMLKVEKGTEDLIIVIYRILDYSQEEIVKLQGKRKGSTAIKKK